MDQKLTETLRDLFDWNNRLIESISAYNRLAAPLATSPAGVAVPLPEFIFKMPTINGESVQCVVPLSEVIPATLPHVLVPLARVFEGRIAEAVREIEACLAVIKPMLLGVIPQGSTTNGPDGHL